MISAGHQNKMLPYPKPITLLSRENAKDLKADFMNAEMNQGVALPISDIRPNTNVESDIFPKVSYLSSNPIKGKNEELFTPPEGYNYKQGEDEGGNKFFITEDETI